MTDKITLELTLDELKTLDKHIMLNDETQMVFHKIRDAYPKPKTLTDIIWNWWDDVFTGETSIQDLVDRIEEWLPKEHDTNSYNWNECIRMIKGNIR